MGSMARGETPTVKRRKALKSIGAAGVVVLAGCTGDGGDGDDGGNTDSDGRSGDDVAAGDPPDDVEEWFAEAASPYEGTELSLVTESTPSSLYYRDEITPRFEEVTGISVDFSAVAFGEMYNREVSTATSNDPSLDVGYIEQDASNAYANNGWLVSIDEFRRTHPDITMPGFDLEDFTDFQWNFNYPPGEGNGPRYSYPMESGLKMLIYRQDVVEDVASDFGYDPDSYMPPDDYMEMAAHIQENTDLTGHSQQHKGVTGAYALTESYWPMFGVYDWGLDPNKWVALESRGGQMNSQRSVEALKFYKEMGEQYSPDGWKSLTWSGVPDTIISERSAMGLIYGENVAKTQEALGDRVASGLQPATQNVVDELEMSASEDPAPAGPAYSGYYNGAGWGIMSASEKQEAAYLYIQWMLRPEASRKLAQNVGLIVRDSAFEAVKDGQINNNTGYFDRFEQHQSDFQGCRVGEVQKALVEGPIFDWLHAFTAGEVDAETAANEMAWESEQVINRLGFLGKTLDEKPF
jgi:multiple sugar transport system substrate-binding protein